MKKCKICGTSFVPRYSSLQRTCDVPACMITYSKQQHHKKQRQELHAMKQRTKTLADYKRELTKYFNRYIRLRDIDKGCISCNKKLTGKYDAGHYLSRGAFPNLAYDELNVHGQCVKCNQHLSGNLIEYGINLPIRIGTDAYNNLLSRRNQPTKLSSHECMQLIKHYKSKSKILLNYVRQKDSGEDLHSPRQTT